MGLVSTITKNRTWFSPSFTTVKLHMRERKIGARCVYPQNKPTRLASSNLPATLEERVWLSLSYTLSLWLVFPCPRMHSHARTHWSAYHMLFWVHSLYSLICYLPISCPDLLCSYLLTQILSLSSYAHFFIHTCTSPCMWTHSHLAGSKQQWIITL